MEGWDGRGDERWKGRGGIVKLSINLKNLGEAG